MFDPDVVPLVQPNPHAAPDPGPRQTASMLAGSNWSNWSNWSNLFIELVKRVLVSRLQNAQPHNHHALLNCPNIPDQWDHLDQANRHAGSSGPSSCSTGRTAWTNSASHGLSQPARRRQSMTTLRRTKESACPHQRGHVVHAAHRHAALRLLRSDHPAQHQRFPLLGSYSFQPVAKAADRHCQAPPSCRVVSSSNAVVPVPPPAGGRFAPTAWQPAPLLSCCMLLWPQSVGKALVRHAKPATPRLAGASCWQDSRSIRGSFSTRPLRPRASLLHNAALPSVPGSHFAKAPFGAGHRWRALRVKATGRYAKWPTLGLLAVVALWHWSGAARIVLVSGLRPVITCVPPCPPPGLAAARHWPPRAGCPSAPPKGELPQPRANSRKLRTTF